MNEEQKIKAEKIEGLVNQGFSKLLGNIFSDVYSILLQVKIPRWLKR